MPMQNSPLNPVPSKALLQYTRKKKKRDEEASVKEVKIPHVCTLEQPRIRRVTKKLLILDANGIPTKMFLQYTRRKRQTKALSCVVSEHEELMPMQNSPLNPVPSKALLQYTRNKKKRDEEAYVKEVKIPDVCTLEQPRIRRVTKKLLILDANGILTKILLQYTRRKRLTKALSCVVSEHEEAMPMQNSPLNLVSSKTLLQYTRKKKKRDEEASVKEVEILDVYTLKQPRIRRVTKKLFILGVIGILADIVSNVSLGYEANFSSLWEVR